MPTADTMGRGIFVLDALTGVRVWKAAYTAGTSSCTGSSSQAACAVSGMNWAIPADISFLDRDNDGKTDRFYAADVGGNVWRVDLEPTGGNTPDKWQVTKFAALGCAAGSCTLGTTPRKFFFPPNVVSVGVANASGAYDVVMLGSGDREHPLKNTATGSSYNVVNRFYALKDTMTGKDASGAVTITEAGLFNATSTDYDKTKSGFYTTFAAGEKSVNASTTVRGTTFFGTNRPTPPSANSCASNLGEAKGYALNPFTGKLNFTIYDGGGLPPTPTTGIVTINTPNGPVDKFFCVGCGGGSGGGGTTSPCNSAIEVCTPGGSVPKNPRRTYWYKQ
jgi:type IV pilus assembly protein PilY1